MRENILFTSSFKTWLKRIIHGKAADYFIGRRPAMTSLAVGGLIDGDDPDSLLNKLPAPHADYDAVIGVRRALQALSIECRTILIMNRAMGYTIKEISQLMGKSPSLVARRLYKAELLFSRSIDGKSNRPNPGNSAWRF
jgi:DNA-directed RNA polymerase specialized sigma24 family protein